MIKKLYIYFLLIVVSSCQFSGNKVPSENELLQERLEQIDWTEVTAFPSVSVCDSLTDKEERKNCFFMFLTEQIQQRLSAETLSVHYPQADTIEMKITVLPDSNLLFEPQFSSDVLYDTLLIDSMIQNRLKDFPAVEPAQKEGIPVKTQFVLPVIINPE